MKIILQHDQRDCGAACLAMISTALGRRLPLSLARSLTRTDRTGTNLYGLIDGAKRLGLNAQAMSGDLDELMKGVENREIAFPFIVHTVSEDGFLHFVVVYGFSKGRFRVADPGQGRLKWTAQAFGERWTGYIVTFQKTEDFQKGAAAPNGFRKFLSAVRGSRARMAAILALSLAISFIGIEGAYVFQFVMDSSYTFEATEEHVHEEGEETSLVTLTLSDVNTVFLALIGLYLLQTGLQVARGWLVVQVSRTMDMKLTMAYYRHVVDLPAAEISKWRTGEYLSRFSDTATIRSAISTAMVTLLLDTVMVAACGIMLLRLNTQMFAVSLGMTAVYAVLVLCYRRPLEKSSRDMMQSDAEVESYFKETIDGAETIKGANANETVKQRATDKFMHFLNRVVHNSVLGMTQDALATMVEMVGVAIVLWIGFVMVAQQAMTIGSLITFYALLSYFTEPIKNLIGLQPTLQAAAVAAERLNDMLEIPAEQNAPDARELPETVRRWELAHVDFRYGNRELTLSDVSLFVERGEKVALVGESGSGKTTVAKLLMRFFSPERGDVLADGESLERLNLTSLRSGVAYVSQETFLFSDTIRNNLTLGMEDVSDAEIQDVCRQCRLEEFIASLHLGLNTPLDENGANLSGGQRQRLAIARALLKKPKLLILDEATSNLDTVTEAAIRQAIEALPGEMACLVIAHRLSTVRTCDRIYVMDDGRAVECGTHEELLARNGLYAQLWKNQ